MKTKKIISNTIIILLLLLWIPVSIDKILNFNSFKSGILRQPLEEPIALFLIYSLPALEVSTVVLLIIEKFRTWGLIVSSILMFAFTTYVALALLGTWDKLPCACGSVISSMSWYQHLWFNLFFLTISVCGWRLNINSKQNQASIMHKKFYVKHIRDQKTTEP